MPAFRKTPRDPTLGITGKRNAASDGRLESPANQINKKQNKHMETMNTFKKNLLVIFSLAALGLKGEAEAADFKLETSVRGHPGYVVVNPSLRNVLGGKIRWNPSLRCFETDRVSRGEMLRVTITPSTRGELCKSGAIAGVTSSNGTAFFQAVKLPYVETRFGVSRDPSFDNVYVVALTTSGRFEMRLPIGKR